MNRELKNLQDLLVGTKFWTAVEIAKKQKCSRPTVYRRINALVDLGAVFKERERPAKAGVTGPRPVEYRITKRARA